MAIQETCPRLVFPAESDLAEGPHTDTRKIYEVSNLLSRSGPVGFLIAFEAIFANLKHSVRVKGLILGCFLMAA